MSFHAPSSSADEESKPEESSEPEQSDFSYTDFSQFGWDAIEITAYEGTDKEVVIPAEIDGKPVVSVTGFYGTEITSVTIPASVTSLFMDSFAECLELEEVIFLGDTPDFKLSAFENTPWLEKALAENTDPNFFIIGNALVRADKENISGDVVVPDSITRICSAAFLDCNNITSITIPDSVAWIGSYAFENCSKMTSIKLPSGITEILGFTFYNCGSLTSVDIPEGVTVIGECVFDNCPNLLVNLPDSLLRFFCDINRATFKGETYIFGISASGGFLADAITTNREVKELAEEKIDIIGNRLFAVDPNATEIEIPDYVTDIHDNAFNNCRSDLIIIYKGKKYDLSTLDKLKEAIGC